MMSKETPIEETVKKVFTEILDLDEGIDWDTVKYQEVEAWDSVAHMSIVAEIEDELDIMIDTDDIIDMSSVKISVDIVTKYVEEK